MITTLSLIALASLLFFCVTYDPKYLAIGVGALAFVMGMQS